MHQWFGEMREELRQHTLMITEELKAQLQKVGDGYGALTERAAKAEDRITSTEDRVESLDLRVTALEKGRGQ
jgi:hypothetical protein